MDHDVWFFCPWERWLQQARKTRHWFVRSARRWTTDWKFRKHVYVLNINWLEKIIRLHINSVLRQVVEMKIKKSTWFGNTVRCYALLSFRFPLPIINSRCILMCEIMHKWDGHSCSIFLWTVWRHLLQGAKAFTARKNPLFFLSFHYKSSEKKISKSPPVLFFRKSSLTYPDQTHDVTN